MGEDAKVWWYFLQRFFSFGFCEFSNETRKRLKDAATDFEFVGMATDNESVVLSSV